MNNQIQEIDLANAEVAQPRFMGLRRVDSGEIVYFPLEWRGADEWEVIM
jgi:hypothetical protein